MLAARPAGPARAATPAACINFLRENAFFTVHLPGKTPHAKWRPCGRPPAAIAINGTLTRFWAIRYLTYLLPVEHAGRRRDGPATLACPLPVTIITKTAIAEDVQPFIEKEAKGRPVAFVENIFVGCPAKHVKDKFATVELGDFRLSNRMLPLGSM
jgi:hypothetical protein